MQAAQELHKDGTEHAVGYPRGESAERDLSDVVDRARSTKKMNKDDIDSKVGKVEPSESRQENNPV